MKKLILFLALVAIPIIAFSQSAGLQGRTVLGTLPRPEYNVEKDGIVVVSIWVDPYGTVQRAVAGAEGTTVTDSELWDAARKAALAAHFNMDADAPALQQGTIIYNFRLSDTRRRTSTVSHDFAPVQLVEVETLSTVFHSSFPFVMSDIFALNAASDARDDDLFFSEEQYWKYVWDLDLDVFNSDAVVLKETNLKTNQERQLRIAPDNLGIYISDRSNRNLYSSKKIYLYQRNTISHGELLGAIDGRDIILIEPLLDNMYCNAYSISFRNELEKPSSRPYKYTKYGADNRLTSFSMDGFSSDDIIGSSRKITPKSPWTITYGGKNRIKTIEKDGVRIDFEWQDDYLGYRRTFSRTSSNHYDIHGMKYSDQDRSGRWTKAILYDYDVVLDKMVPVYSIERIFVPRENLDQVDNRSSSIYVSPDTNSIPFQLVEEKPSFNGGDANEFSKWVNSKLVYPEIAKNKGIQGRVTLQFTINKDGSISNVKVIQGVDSSLDKEAVRVVSSSPKWKPGKNKGEAVKVTYTFPVIFQLR